MATTPGGGAIEAWTNLVIAQCLFTTTRPESATWHNGGGAVKLVNSVTSMSATRFISNKEIATAGGASGAAILCLRHDAVGRGCLFDKNNATSEGAVYFENAGCAISNSTISNNTSTWGNGAGLRAWTNCSLTLNNCVFSTNTTPFTGTNAGGGALYAENASIVNATGCSFYGNTAQYGGAIRVITNTPLKFDQLRSGGQLLTADGRRDIRGRYPLARSFSQVVHS